MMHAVVERERHCESLPRRRALFFFYGCFLRRTDGCHVRAMQTLDLMIASGLDVIIYSYRQHPAWPWTPADEVACARRYPSARLVLDDGGPKLDWLARTKRRLSLLGPRPRKWALEQGVPRLTPGLDALKARRDIDLVVISYAEGLTQLNGLPDAPIIVDTHDVTVLERVRLQSSGDLDMSTLRALKSEIGLLGVADVVWSISYAEFWFLQEMLNRVRVRFVPPTLEATPLPPGTHPDFDLLFVGSDNRWNTTCLLAFFDDFVTWQHPFSLAVAGRVCLDARVEKRAAGISGVELLGYQPDLPALYRRTRATICPVEGTGTKIKLIESLAFERPVFAAPGAFRGLVPGYEGCVLELEESSVAAVLNDPAALDRARSACRAYAKAYSFDAVRRTVAPDFLIGPRAATSSRQPVAAG